MNPICKHCKKKLDGTITYRLVKMDKAGYYYVCADNFGNNHEPMNNLDYIEWVAKKKKLV